MWNTSRRNIVFLNWEIRVGGIRYFWIVKSKLDEYNIFELGNPSSRNIISRFGCEILFHTAPAHPYHLKEGSLHKMPKLFKNRSNFTKQSLYFSRSCFWTHLTLFLNSNSFPQFRNRFSLRFSFDCFSNSGGGRDWRLLCYALSEGDFKTNHKGTRKLVILNKTTNIMFIWKRWE